jgi:hypothetical protein
VNTYVVALTYATVSTAVIPLCFAFFKTQYEFLDVLLAAIGSATLSLIPTLGGVASIAGLIGILYWRMRRDLLFPDIVMSVAAARLTTVPVLLLLIHK